MRFGAIVRFLGDCSRFKKTGLLTADRKFQRSCNLTFLTQTAAQVRSLQGIGSSESFEDGRLARRAGGVRVGPLTVEHFGDYIFSETT